MKFDGDLRNHLTLTEVNEQCRHLRPGDIVILPAKITNRDEACPALVTRIYPYVIEFLLPFGYKRHVQKFDCMNMPIYSKGELHNQKLDQTLITALLNLEEIVNG